jgi:glycosyltransferase involved in cell wall biosynthesis
MRIALLSFEYPPETGFGGIGTYTWYQARALVKLGHVVHVLAGAGGSSERRLRTVEHDGVIVHRIKSDGLVSRAAGLLGAAGLRWTRSRIENGWSMYRGLRELLERHAYDVIEMPECGGEGWIVNQLIRGARTVVRFHSPAQLIMDSYPVSRPDVAGCSRLERLAMTGAGALTSCSRFLADEVTTRIGLARPIEVIPNGIDLALFDAAEPMDVRRRFNLPAERPIILFTGRIETRKGIELCPEIVRTVLERHDVAFVFAGRDTFGYMEKTLLPSVRSRTLRGSIHYLGDLDFVTVRACLRNAAIFLLPSLWENCPYSCVEAMAAGTAIVAADQGGMPELITHGTSGLLARCGDPASFVEQLERLIGDEALRGRLAAAARRAVETRLTDVHIAGQSVAFYRRAFDL